MHMLVSSCTVSADDRMSLDQDRRGGWYFIKICPNSKDCKKYGKGCHKIQPLIVSQVKLTKEAAIQI